MDALVPLGERRVLAPGRLRWLRALLWIPLLGLVVIGAYVGVSNGVLQLGGARLPAAAWPWLDAAATLLGALACLEAYALAIRWGEDRRPTELAPRALLPELLGGIVIGGAIMSLSVLILWAAGLVEIARQPVTHVLRAVALAVQSGVLEETLFRLVVFRLVWRAVGMWPALAFSALLFGGLHLTNPNATPFAALCIALEAGILLAAFFMLTGRAWLPIGVHAGWNFAQGWVYGAAVSGTVDFAGGPMTTLATPGVSPILSGGDFGPEASLPGLVVATGAGLVTLWLARRAALAPQ